jgi:hypothetical protein
MFLLRYTILYIFRKKGEEKPGVALNTIPNPVYYAMIMIKRPTTSRLHATVNPMTFVFTVK